MPYIASMGIYVLKASAIRKLLQEHFPEVCLTACASLIMCPVLSIEALIPVGAPV